MKLMEEQNMTICPWCDSEIVWDAEIGPESHCPHCDNELSNYRTLSLGDEDELQNKNVEVADSSEDDEWGDMLEEDGFRQGDLAYLEVQEKVQQILDKQDEVPECPACREYMVLTGTHAVHDSFKPVTPLGFPLVDAALELSLYVCPACFETSTKLGASSREKFIQSLGGK